MSFSFRRGLPYHIIVAAMLFTGAVSAFGSDPIVISGASSTEGISIMSSIGTVSYPLSLENTTNADIKSVKIEVSDFVGPNARSWEARLLNPQSSPTPSQSLTINIPKLQKVNLILTARAPEAGLYQSSLALIYGNKRHPIPLKVNRTMVAPSVKILGLDSVAVAGFDGRSVHFTIKEINGIDVRLNPPTLTSLSLKDGDKSLQAQYDKASLVHVAPDGEHPINSPFTVTGKQAYPIRMYITGLNAPGQYSASLDIGTDDGSLDAQIVTIFVKRSFLIALISIAIGVLISMGIRKYTTENRPRLLLRRQLSLLKNDIDNLGSRLPEAADQAILVSLVRRLEKTDGDIELGQTNSVDAIVSDVDQKLTLLPDLSALRRRIEGMLPAIDTTEARNAVKVAADLMNSPNNAAKDDFENARKGISAADTNLNSAIQKYIQGQISNAQTEMGHSDSSLTSAHRDEFSNEVQERFSQAADEAQKHPPNIGEAARLIDQARRAAARIFVDDLREKIRRPEDMPDAVWIPLESLFARAASRARAADTGDKATAAYKEADSAWLAVMFEALASQAAMIADQAKKGSSEAHKSLVKVMEEQQEEIEKGRSALSGNDLSEAHEIYATVKKAIDEALSLPEAAPAAAKMMGASSGKTYVQRLSGFFDSPGILTISGINTPAGIDRMEPRTEFQFMAVSNIEKKIKHRDRWVTGISAVIAILLGIYLLWSDNLTWGSLKDMAAAVLWGLGIHQIAGNAPFAKLDIGVLQSQLSGASGRSGSDAKA